MDENNRIIIKRVTRNQRTGAPEEETLFRAGSPSAGGRWFTYLFLAPVFIVMAVLGIFFFTAFLALFAVAAASLVFRLWWLRRKLRQSMEEEGEYVVIEDAEIVEERTSKATGTRNQERQ